LDSDHQTQLTDALSSILEPLARLCIRHGVVHGWLNDAEFLDKKNTPLVLPIKNTKKGKEFGSFVALVKRYSQGSQMNILYP